MKQEVQKKYLYKPNIFNLFTVNMQINFKYEIYYFRFSSINLKR